jgi:glyoxylase-like metal-dependent hydrolase (beta-lactamase superfamily II)
VRDGGTSTFLAGDTSYSQQLLLDGGLDGVAGDEDQARQTTQNILQYLRTESAIYLPSHDTEAADRLAQKDVVSFPA